MIDETTAQDIQSEVDGETLPEESARIRALIARDPEAAALYQELKELAETLAALPSEQPPAEMRQVVVESAAWRAQAAGIRRKHQPPASDPGIVRSGTQKEGTVNKKFAIAGLVAAGIAAVVIYVGISGFPPKNDQAAGTIGAVKKHRVEQISESDVVLGTSESSPEWVPFADLVGDAAAFGSFSTKLEALSRNAGAKAGLDAKSFLAGLRAIEATLGNRASELQSRGIMDLQRAGDQLSRATALAPSLESSGISDLNRISADRVGAITLEAKELSGRVDSGAITLAEAGARLGALARELQAGGSLDARTLEATRQTQDLTRMVESKSNLDSKTLQANINSLSRTLDARSVDLAAGALEARGEFIDATARAHGDLAAARREFGALASQLEASSKLGAKELEALNARAAVLQGRAADLEKSGLLGMRRQLDSADRNHVFLMEMKGNLELAAKQLENRNLDLQARDVLSKVNTSVGVQSLAAGSYLVEACRNDLGAMERTLGARDAVLGASTLEAVKGQADIVRNTLESHASQLGAKELQSAQEKLGSVNQALQARTPEAQ